MALNGYLKLFEELEQEWKETKDFCGYKWNTDLDAGYGGDCITTPYEYNVDIGESIVHDQLKWCTLNCVGRFYRDRKNKIEHLPLYVMCFENELDAIAFKLRWI